MEAGRVRIGERIAVMGDQVEDGEVVFVDDIPVKTEHKAVILAYHKPRGVICTTSEKERFKWQHFRSSISPASTRS